MIEIGTNFRILRISEYMPAVMFLFDLLGSGLYFRDEGLVSVEMGFTTVNVRISNPADPKKWWSLELLVDTGAIYSIVPAKFSRAWASNLLGNAALH